MAHGVSLWKQPVPWVVTGNDWRLLELQERYAGHFSPFINARIAKLYRPWSGSHEARHYGQTVGGGQAL